MYIEEYERASPYILCMMGLFCSFLWAGLLYFFINMINLPKSWGALCSYFIFTIVIWNTLYILYKCPHCKKNDIEIDNSIPIEPPEYSETEVGSPPDYDSSIEEIV